MPVFEEVLLEASYEDVAFPVESEEGDPAKWGSVKRKAYRRPGADNEPTGLEPREGVLSVVLFNDVEAGLFPDRYDRLIDVVRRKPIGKLVHPVEGVLTAMIDSIHRTTSAQEREGVRLKIQWTEHNTSDVNLLRVTDELQPDAPEAAMQQAAEADTAMATAVANQNGSSEEYTPTLPVVSKVLDAFETAKQTAAQIEAGLREIQDIIQGNLDATIFASTTAYEAVVALRSLAATVVKLRARYLPDASKIRKYLVPVTMSCWQVSLQVYGEATHADKIMEANVLPDPLFIAPGSVLTILPLT